MLYKKHKEQYQKDFSNLLNSVNGFYAFGEVQLNKEMEKRGIKEKNELILLNGFGGLIIPKNKKQRFENEFFLLNEKDKKRTQELENNKKELKKAIIYELNNHECLYTYDLNPVYRLFPKHKKMVLREYKKLENRHFS